MNFIQNRNVNSINRKNVRNRIDKQINTDFLRFNHSTIHIEKLKEYIENFNKEDKDFVLPLINQLEDHLGNINQSLCKYDFLPLLKGYKFFNLEKFDCLSWMCFADKLLAALNLSKYDNVFPYFTENKDIIVQTPIYTVHQVGDSDNGI